MPYLAASAGEHLRPGGQLRRDVDDLLSTATLLDLLPERVNRPRPAQSGQRVTSYASKISIISLRDVATGPSGSGSVLIDNQQPNPARTACSSTKRGRFPGDLVTANPENSGSGADSVIVRLPTGQVLRVE